MNPIKIIRNSWYTIFGCFVLCIPFGIDEDMVNGLITGKVYWLAATGILLFSAFLISEGMERSSGLRLRIPDALLTLLLASILLTYNWKVNPNPTALIFTLQILISWFLFRQMCDKAPSLSTSFIIVLIGTGGLQAFWGLVQIYGLAGSNHVLFRVTGFFPNPGPYSGYLAFILPLAVGYMLRVRKLKAAYKKRFRALYYISMICSILIILVLPSGLSRSAWLAALVSVLWVIWKYRLGKRKYKIFLKKSPAKLILLTTTVVLLSAGVVGMLYHLKKDSADGRFLMWKVTTLAFLENPVTGTGIGGFPEAFARAQANYLESNGATAQEKLVAGCPAAAFNEYLQLLTELGIFGFLFFAGWIATVIYITLKKKRFYIVGALMSLLIFAFSSYPFRDPSFLPALIVLSVIGITDRRSYKANYQKFIPYVIILLTLVFLGLSGYQLYRMNYYLAWNKVKVLHTNKAYEIAARNYAPLYPGLHHDPAYLFEYSQCLGECGNHEEAILHLERACMLSSDPMIRCMLGKNELKRGNFQKSEAYYRQALRILPERIYPYYLMTELYAHPDNYHPDKLRMVADSVFYKAPKVESTAIQEMRQKTRKILQGIENEQNQRE